MAKQFEGLAFPGAANLAKNMAGNKSEKNPKMPNPLQQMFRLTVGVYRLL